MTEAGEAWTIQRVLTWSTDYLKDKSSSTTPRLDAELLLAHALSVPRLHLYTHFDKPLSAPERDPFKRYLMRRGGGEPVAYITGHKEFMGLAFAVTQAVLIPRPDTETLVEAALAEAATFPTPPRILDVGTGSGCIAVSLAHRLTESEVEAWDIDPEALALARSNAARHGVDRIFFREIDALADASWADGRAFDLIVSNPPYIAPEEEPDLMDSVVKFEPRRALFAADGGLVFYRRFAACAAAKLAFGGRLIVEIGAGQGASVAALLRDHGWSGVTVKKDYAKIGRVVVAVKAPGGPS